MGQFLVAVAQYAVAERERRRRQERREHRRYTADALGRITARPWHRSITSDPTAGRPEAPRAWGPRRDGRLTVRVSAGRRRCEPGCAAVDEGYRLPRRER